MANNLKANINWLDSEIRSSLAEKFTIKKTFNGITAVIEGIKDHQNLKLILEMQDSDLEQGGTMTWSYLANPSDAKSKVQRTCNLHQMPSVLQDIVEKKRFDADYLQSLNVVQ